MSFSEAAVQGGAVDAAVGPVAANSGSAAGINQGEGMMRIFQGGGGAAGMMRSLPAAQHAMTRRVQHDSMPTSTQTMGKTGHALRPSMQALHATEEYAQQGPWQTNPATQPSKYGLLDGWLDGGSTPMGESAAPDVFRRAGVGLAVEDQNAFNGGRISNDRVVETLLLDPLAYPHTFSNLDTLAQLLPKHHYVFREVALESVGRRQRHQLIPQNQARSRAVVRTLAMVNFALFEERRDPFASQQERGSRYKRKRGADGSVGLPSASLASRGRRHDWSSGCPGGGRDTTSARQLHWRFPGFGALERLERDSGQRGTGPQGMALLPYASQAVKAVVTIHGETYLRNVWLGSSDPLVVGSRLWLLLVRRDANLTNRSAGDPNSANPLYTPDWQAAQMYSGDEYSVRRATQLRGEGYKPDYFWRYEPFVTNDFSEAKPHESVFNCRAWQGYAQYVGLVRGEAHSDTRHACRYRSMVSKSIYPRNEGRDVEDMLVNATRLPRVKVAIGIRSGSDAGAGATSARGSCPCYVLGCGVDDSQ